MRKSTITSNKETEFDEKIQRIVEKFMEIADTYFKHPVKSLGVMKVPFEEHDVLDIRFREPVELPYNIEVACYSNNLCESIVHRSNTSKKLIQLSWVFKNGFVEALNGITIRRKLHTLAIYPTGFEFAMMFMPDMLKRIENADISSNHGVAAKWFIELLNAYREAGEFTISLSDKDLYDVGRSISYVVLEFFHLRFGITLRDVNIRIVLKRNNKLVEFETDIPLPEDSIPYQFEHLVYSLESKRLVSLKGKAIRKIVMRFPEKIIDETNEFLKKLFDVYLQTLIAMSYVYHTLY